MIGKISFQETIEVQNTFNLNVYLFKYYRNFSDDLILLYDSQTDTKKFLYYESLLNEYVNSKNKNIDLDSIKIAERILLILRSIYSVNSHVNRQKALEKYDELEKNNNDFDNPEKAPDYANQIVEAYFEEVSSYPQILGVVINQKSVHFQVLNEEKFFNALNITPKKTDKKSVENYAKLLTLEFQGKNIELENNDEYFLENYGIVRIFPVQYL